jgi:hypothetical protein
MLRPELRGGEDNSGRVGNRTFGFSERRLRSMASEASLGNLSEADANELIQAAFHEGRPDAFLELLNHTRSVTTSFVPVLKRMRARPTERSTTVEPSEELWEKLPGIVRSALLDEAHGADSEPEIESSIIRLLRGISGRPASKAASRFRSIHVKDSREPLEVRLGAGALARAMGLGTAPVRDAVLDLTSFWSMRRAFEVDYIREVDSSIRTVFPEELPTIEPTNPAVDASARGFVARRLASLDDELSRQIWESEVKRPTDLYLETLKALYPSTRGYANAAESFKNDLVLWEFLRFRFNSAQLTPAVP